MYVIITFLALCAVGAADLHEDKYVSLSQYNNAAECAGAGSDYYSTARLYINNGECQYDPDAKVSHACTYKGP